MMGNNEPINLAELEEFRQFKAAKEKGVESVKDPGHKHQPFAKVNISNGVQIVFWENERKGKDGGAYKALSVSLTKSWKDQESQQWQRQAVNMNMNDLFRLFAVQQQCKDIEQRFKDGGRG